jgi:hypothetical protein
MGIGVVTYLSKKRPEALATVEETLGNVES